METAKNTSINNSVGKPTNSQRLLQFKNYHRLATSIARLVPSLMLLLRTV